MDISNNNNDEKMTHLDKFLSRISECLELLKQISQCGSELKAIQKKWMFGAVRIMKKVLSGEVFPDREFRIFPKLYQKMVLVLPMINQKSLPKKIRKKTWGYYWRIAEEKGWNSMDAEELKEWREDE